MLIMPSVAMNGGSPSARDEQPVQQPHDGARSPGQRAIAAGTGSPACSALRQHDAGQRDHASPRTGRCRRRGSRTSCRPRSTALIVVCSMTLSRLETVRKCGVRIKVRSTQRPTRPRQRAELTAGRMTRSSRSRRVPQRCLQHPFLGRLGAASNSATRRPAAHHEDAVAHAQHLGQLRRDHQDRRRRAPVSRFISS